MKKNKASGFKLDSFTVVNFNIERKPIKQTKGEIDIEPSGVIDRKSKNFSLILNVKVKDKNDSFNLSLTSIGSFLFRDDMTSKELSNYFLTNAPAIIFPYVRAYISSVTALSGLAAVNLPVMNLSNLRDELSKNIKELDYEADVI
ncbi:protein-export chaperone SecB [Pedobacter antarcticus]|uniref:protein-export chaperone SecB n=1 Tax=Pedobacter antarcticus TaxID=34086 RepID=UPI00292DCEC8|nr:protein-export chaperone SecB [Pedobacter antarcticus]